MTGATSRTAALAVAASAGLWGAKHRRSAAVKLWRPSALPTRRAGALHVRSAGVVGAHSMGSALALRWLERRRDKLASITCFGPPVYPTSHAVDATIASAGVMAQAFVANTRWAQLACHVNCSHRRAAGITAALVTPGLPWQIAKAASLHTWPAYRDAMDPLIVDIDWERLTKLACDLDVPVTMVWGSDDRIGDRSYTSDLQGVRLLEVPDAGHHLPLTHASLYVEQLGHHRRKPSLPNALATKSAL